MLYTLGADGKQTLLDSVAFLYRVYIYSNDEMQLFGLFVVSFKHCLVLDIIVTLDARSVP
jgi:hypothetical protein